jgi:hypothetical protein
MIKINFIHIIKTLSRDFNNNNHLLHMQSFQQTINLEPV